MLVKICFNNPGIKLEHLLKKLKICRHMLTSSTQLQNRSFHERERLQNVKRLCISMKDSAIFRDEKEKTTKMGRASQKYNRN